VMDKQYLFLTQFLGGPALFSERYGHPMMRARHLPFPVTPQRAAAWLSCMSRALAETNIPAPVRDAVILRLSAPAHHFINSEDPS
jgi:hemoglobin